MFILTNDGGLVSPSSQDQENDAARILVQRHFLFENMKSGIAVVLLQSADFKDGKVRRNSSAIFGLPILTHDVRL